MAAKSPVVGVVEVAPKIPVVAADEVGEVNRLEVAGAAVAGAPKPNPDAVVAVGRTEANRPDPVDVDVVGV